MPEYLAPGVFVEEVSYRAKSIEGVSTTTTAFIGPTRTGPIIGEPEILTSFAEFERRYGGLDPLQFAPDLTMANYMAHAVRAFFNNGGRRLYIARAYRALSADAGVAVPAGQDPDGIARANVPAPSLAMGAVQDSAGAAVSEARTALERATAAIGDARTASGTLAARSGDALEALRDQVQAGFPAPVAAINALDMDAADEAAITTAVTDAIAALPNADRPAAQAAFDTALPAIQRALADRGANAAITNDANGAQSAINTQNTRASNVEQQGRAAGEAAAIPADPNAAANTVAAAARTAQTNVRTSGRDVDTARQQLGRAVETLRTATGAALHAAVAGVADAVRAAITAANAAVTSATAALDAAQAGFSAATVARRATAAAKSGVMRARYPGAAGNMLVRVRARVGQNVRAETGTPPRPILRQARDRELVTVRGSRRLFFAERDENGAWSFVDGAGGAPQVLANMPASTDVRIVTLSVEVQPPGQFAQPQFWDNLSAHPDRGDSLQRTFAEDIANSTKEIETPLVITIDGGISDLTFAEALVGENLASIDDWANKVQYTDFHLAGGNDGLRPTNIEYEGLDGENDGKSTGLFSLEDLEEISILAAPGVSFGASQLPYGNTAAQITQSLIAHCDRMAYRVAVLDSPDNTSISGVRENRAPLDTTRAAFYYPWVKIQDPVTQQPINVPPSGFVSGIYARNDINRGVHKAPANEVVIGAIGLETLVNKSQQEILNPLGINCLRFFENRGNRVWGARTLSSDPEWKYLNIRRYFAFLERSIERSTQWAVFEPNGEDLWANVRRSVEDFLYNEWKSEHLAGAKPAEAFFVLCDRTTMSQNDLDNGRMICLIGVAPLYPAEFVIFRIGQWTADSPVR